VIQAQFGEATLIGCEGGHFCTGEPTRPTEYAAKELMNYFSSKMSISDVRSSSNRMGMPCNS